MKKFMGVMLSLLGVGSGLLARGAALRPPAAPGVRGTGGEPAGARRGWRIIRWAALLLALAGAGLFFHGFTHRAAPLTRIGLLRPDRNAAVVRVQGRAAGDAQVARVDGRINSLHFIVDDDTGQLPVIAGAAPARTLAQWDRVPRDGDPVTVAGRLGVAAGNQVSLQLQRAEDLQLTRKARSAALPPRSVRAPE